MDFILRKFKEEDAESLCKAADNNKISDNLRDGFPKPYLIEHAATFIQSCKEDDEHKICRAIEKRKSIAEICAKYNVMVLEDDPYRELRYFGKPQPSIKSFDTAGNVIYASSFSKTISPGMRVGSAIADPAVIRKLTVGKQAVDVQTVTLMQAVAERFIQDDTLDKHIEKSIPVYREKKVAMIDAIKKFMPSEFKYTDPEGGLFIWGEYPNVSVKDKFSEAIANNVAYIWGTEFYADGRGGDCMRLNFSNASVEQIYTGIERLSKVFKK